MGGSMFCVDGRKVVSNVGPLVLKQVSKMRQDWLLHVRLSALPHALVGWILSWIIIQRSCYSSLRPRKKISNSWIGHRHKSSCVYVDISYIIILLI